MTTVMMDEIILKLFADLSEYLLNLFRCHKTLILHIPKKYFSRFISFILCIYMEIILQNSLKIYQDYCARAREYSTSNSK